MALLVFARAVAKILGDLAKGWTDQIARGHRFPTEPALVSHAQC